MVQETSFANDRDQKTKHTVTVTKGTRDNPSHKVRRQSISQEGGARLSNFVKKRMFTEGDPSLPHTMTSVPGSSMLFAWRGTKDSWETARRILPPNTPWHLCGWEWWELESGEDHRTARTLRESSDASSEKKVYFLGFQYSKLEFLLIFLK